MKYVLATAALSFTFISQSALALRCGTKLVDEGSRAFEVLKLCGEPISKQTRSIFRTKSVSVKDGYGYPQKANYNEREQTKEIAVEIQIDEWVYNFGPNRLSQQISFENGVVIKIESLGYGF